MWLKESTAVVFLEPELRMAARIITQRLFEDLSGIRPGIYG